MTTELRIVAIGVAALVAMLALFWLHPLVIARLEFGLLDARFRLRGPLPPEHPIAIVAIDEKSVDELGRWPWRRSVMANLIDRLTEADVAAIGLDIVFSEPESTPEAVALEQVKLELEQRGVRGPAVETVERALERADTDRRLADAIARSGRLALGFFFRTEASTGRVPDPQDLRDVVRGVVNSRGLENVRMLSCSGVEPNLRLFMQASKRLGFLSSIRDRDGVLRRVALIAHCGDHFYASLALAVAEIALGKRTMVLGEPIPGSPGEHRVRELRLAGRSIPTDEGGQVLVNWRGGAESFPHYSAVDVIRGEVPAEALAGALVLVGATETGIGDVVPSPFERVFPGVEVHANVLDNLLSGQVLRRTADLTRIEVAEMIALGLLLILVIPRLQISMGALMAAGLLAAHLGVATWLFVEHGIWLDITYPSTMIVSVFLAVGVSHAVRVQSRARMIRTQYSTYVPPEVVNQMIENPDEFRLGTQRRDLSILFSDIRNFTTIAEEIGPEEVSHLLDAYLTPMTRIVFESGGTLDKYIGDAVMAFWGAPHEVAEHPRHACDVAISMQEELARLKAEHPELPAIERVRIGVGIHSAEVVVGNMGSELRFDYTISGDGVNLCSRLEGLTKYYGVGILASSQLVERLPKGFISREVDAIRVKGRAEAVRIFEIVGRENGETDTRFLDGYAEALGYWRAGDWEQAERALRAVVTLRSDGDGPSELLLDRMRDLDGKPPPDWNGVWTFQEK